jgi:hypothetical protein
MNSFFEASSFCFVCHIIIVVFCMYVNGYNNAGEINILYFI